MTPSQWVWKVKCHFFSSGSSSFFVSEDPSSISLFDTQLSGRDWLEKNQCDEVHLTDLKGKTTFPYSPEDGEWTHIFPRPVWEVELYGSVLQYSCSLHGSACPCTDPGD